MARQQLVGTFLRQTDDKTIVVRVERKMRHPKYGKTITTHKNYLVDFRSDQTLNEGDEVVIGEVKPVSKRKSFEFVSKFDKA